EWGLGFPVAIERLLEAHEAADIDFCVVSNPVHYVKGKPEAEQLRLVWRANEYAAEIQQRYPDRIVALASTIPGGGPEYVKDLERAIRDYKLRGVLINSSHEGRYPDTDAATPFFELMNELRAPIMVHAPASSFGEDLMRPCRLISSLGRPFDEALSLARMIVLGVLERFPDLNLVVSHLGGGISEFIGRMDYAYEFGDAGAFLTGGPYEPLCITQKPSLYLQRVYLDTVSYHAPALLAAMYTVGASHLLFASDAPPMLPLLPRAKKLIEELPISPNDKQLIFRDNAAGLLGL
ncbi:MAG: amidohydrolase family protein, partial [Chloroflexota bacterium]